MLQRYKLTGMNLYPQISAFICIHKPFIPNLWGCRSPTIASASQYSPSDRNMFGLRLVIRSHFTCASGLAEPIQHCIPIFSSRELAASCLAISESCCLIKALNGCTQYFLAYEISFFSSKVSSFHY